MRMTQKRKPKALNGEEVESSKEGKGFYACYLLTSLCPRFKGHTYIGFTVNPRRRIKQHNGEMRCGAFRTKKRRPWEMVLCLYGFPSNVSALQFEWAWQHPMESKAVRQAAATFRTFSGVSNKIKLAYTMLNLPSWNSLNITVNYFSTFYMKHHAACSRLPEHMKVQVCSMDELPCYTKMGESVLEDEDAEIGLDEELQTCGNNSQPTTDFGFDEILNIEELQTCGSNSQPVPEIGFEEAQDITCGINSRPTTDSWFDEPVNKEKLQDRDTDSQLTAGSNSQPVTEIGFEEAQDIACGINSRPTTDSWFDEPVNKEKLQDRGTDSRRTALPSLVSFSSRDSAARNMGPLAEESVYELDSPQRSEFTSKMAFDDSISKTHCWWSESTCKIASDKYQLLIDSPAASHPVEVIDLLSPSPDCRISFISKKRRVSVVSPVIDLT